jgi:hypothetical protein
LESCADPHGVALIAVHIEWIQRMKYRITALVAFALWSASPASAQTRVPAETPFVTDILKGVALDPTTYAPGLITYGAMRLDWDSSQVFFRNGYVEQNADYTVSGVGNTTSISYRSGNRRIAADSARVLQMSLVHNVSERIIERGLARRYPSHRKLVRVVGRIERIAAASYISYIMSAVHFSQWRKNEELARQLGYR